MRPLSPLTLEIIVLILGLFLLFAESFSKSENKNWIAETAIFVLFWVFGFSFFTTVPDAAHSTEPMWRFYSGGASALFYKRIALLTTIVVLLMSIEYRGVLGRFLPSSRPGAGLGEFYFIPVFTCAGLMFMASAVDFLMIFVSLELVTISFYVLVAYMRRNKASLEAGVKYLILGALSTGFLVYGITWIYGITGETNLQAIATKLPTLHGVETPLLFGVMLVLVGLGFKVAAAPFQLWAPDVYTGAPTPVTAFLSVGSKAAGFIVLMRVLEPFLGVPALSHKILGVIGILAALSMLYGNLAAMPQENFKRMLAYSSIGHAGYILVAIASFTALPGPASTGYAVSYYLAGYLFMTLLAFLIMVVVANHSRGDDIAHFNGLGKRSPFLAFAMLIAIASLAGVPFTVGFYGKLLVFMAAVQQQKFVLVGIGAIAVATGFYYYFRVISAMFWQDPTDETPIKVSAFTRITIAALAAAIIFFGVYQKPVLDSLSEPGSHAVAHHAAPAAVAPGH